MNVREANFKIGDRYKVTSCEGLWIVDEIVERGIISKHCGVKGLDFDGKPYWIVIPGSHKHLEEWTVEIVKM